MKHTYYKHACLLFAVMIFFAKPADALFRYHKAQAAANFTPPPVGEHLQRNLRIGTVLSYLHPGWRGLHRHGRNPEDRYNSMAEGVVSFICSIFCIISFAALGLTSFQLFAIPVFIFAILAAVFGVIGLKRRKPGYATIGLVLGILEIIAGLMVLAFVSWL